MTHVSGLSGGAGRIDEGSLPRGPGNGGDGVPALVAGGGDGLRAAGGVLRDGAVELGILELAAVGCIGCRALGSPPPGEMSGQMGAPGALSTTAGESPADMALQLEALLGQHCVLAAD